MYIQDKLDLRQPCGKTASIDCHVKTLIHMEPQNDDLSSQIGPFLYPLLLRVTFSLSLFSLPVRRRFFLPSALHCLHDPHGNLPLGDRKEVIAIDQGTLEKHNQRNKENEKASKPDWWEATVCPLIPSIKVLLYYVSV